MGGGKIRHATQNLVESVRTIIFDTAVVMTNTLSANLTQRKNTYDQ